jgi:hypothetical protein
MDGGTENRHSHNRVPSKSVPKILYELWTGREPSLNHLHVWGYPAEAKVFNPNIGKLDSRQSAAILLAIQKDRKDIASIVLTAIRRL